MTEQHVVAGELNAKPKWRGHFGMGMLVLLCVAGLVLISPWTLHMGGRPTPSLIWHGYGKMSLSGKGTNSVLFLELNALGRGSQKAGKRAGWTRSDNIGGTAIVCTDKGDAIPFDVRGGVDAWLDADGKPVTLHLTAPVNSAKKYQFWLYGKWEGRELVLEDRGTLDPLITKANVVSGKPPTKVNPQVAPVTRTVTLNYGKKRDFDPLCGENTGTAF